MAAAAAGRVVQLCTESWAALGTTAVLRYSGAADPAVRAAVEDRIDAVDRAASRFRDDSELSALNGAGGQTMRVRGLLLEAVRLAVRAAELTGGAVDPTLGESLVAAGYDRDFAELAAVGEDAPLVGPPRIVVTRRRDRLWREIRLGDDPPAITLPAGVMLDLGATAKALAADLAAEGARAALVAAGHGGGALVALGGDIATAGAPPEGGWGIHVTDDHRSSADAEGQTIAIGSGGLATSSIVARRWLHRGNPVHHLLDPRDGGPVQGPWRTVSVAAASCAEANIASTAAIVLGDRGLEWLSGQDLPARLVALDGAVTAIGGWPT